VGTLKIFEYIEQYGLVLKTLQAYHWVSGTVHLAIYLFSTFMIFVAIARFTKSF